MLVTAAAQVAIALGIHRIASPFPPVVTGTIILVIGLGLLPSGVNLAAGGAPVTLAVAGLVLVLVLTVVLDQFCRGLLCTVSVLIAVVVGYLVSIPLGLLDPSGVGDRPVVAVPTPFEFGVSFQLVAVLSMAVVGVVNTVDSVGTVHAVTEGGAGRPATVRELRGDRRQRIELRRHAEPPAAVREEFTRAARTAPTATRADSSASGHM